MLAIALFSPFPFPLVLGVTYTDPAKKTWKLETRNLGFKIKKFPTGHFTILKTQDQKIGEVYVSFLFFDGFNGSKIVKELVGMAY